MQSHEDVGLRVAPTGLRSPLLRFTSARAAANGPAAGQLLAPTRGKGAQGVPGSQPLSVFPLLKKHPSLPAAPKEAARGGESRPGGGAEGTRPPLPPLRESRAQARPPRGAHLGCRCLPFPHPGAHPSCGRRPPGSSSSPGRLWAWRGPLPGRRPPPPGCSPLETAAGTRSPAPGGQSPPSRLACPLPPPPAAARPRPLPRTPGDSQPPGSATPMP